MVARSGILKRTFPVSINRVKATANQDLKVLTPFVGGLERYLQIMFRGMTDFILSALVKTGTTVQSLKYEEFEWQPCPLPPLAEQHRIVAKVDELMALCDRLEAAQAERERQRDRLSVASLYRLNQPAADVSAFREHARFHLQHLPRLTTRPDQIPVLRQTILNLAVRGKLVHQDPNDEPIQVALRRSLDGRAALVRATGIRHKKLDECADLTTRGDFPVSWAVERLGNLVDPENTISYGVLVPGNDVPDGVPFVRVQDLSLTSHAARPNKTISAAIEKAYGRTRLRGGEILLCVVGATIGRLGIVPPSWAGANIARAVARILPVPEISRDYLLVVLRGKPVQTYFSETTRTLAQPTLNVGAIKQTPIPLPPLAEQHRIVAKVNELMAVCDRLEVQLTTTRTESHRLLEAVLHEALAPARLKEVEMALHHDI
jgi:type I restriction enzyme S subunit